MNIQSRAIQVRSYRWIIFVLLAIGYLLVNFHRLCPAVVALDLMEDLKASGGLIGLLASAYFYPYAFMQIPSGLLADSWGPRKTITAFFFLAGVASIGFGFALTAGWAIFARVLVGVGVSMLFVPIMKILTHWFKVSEFSFMTGILVAVGGLGSLTAATPLAYLSTIIGWRGSFVIIGVVTLLSAVAIWIFVRNTPEEMGYPAVEKEGEKLLEPPPKMSLWEGIQFVLRSVHFWPLAIWFFFSLGIFFSFGGLWGGPYFMEVYNLNKQEAGAILSMFAIAMIVGSPILSYLSDRIFHSRKKMLIASSFVLLFATIPLAFFPADLNIPLLYILSFLIGMFGCAIVVVGFSTTKELFPVEIAGTSVGLVNLFPFLGGAVMQPLLGVVLDWHGQGAEGYSAAAYGHAFVIYFVSAVIALIAACFAKETFPRKEIA